MFLRASNFAPNGMHFIGFGTSPMCSMRPSDTKVIMSILPQTYVYKTTSHCDIHLDVYHSSSNSDPSPAIIWIHGGALIGGSRKRYIREMYLALGFTVVTIDYRLAPETKLPLIIEDVQDAFKWIREKGRDLFRIDSSRLAVTGHSAGGYLTLMAGTFFPRPKALVSFYGYGDIIGDWLSKPSSFYCNQPAVLKEDAYRFYKGQPFADVRKDRGPFYLYCRQQGLWPKEIGGRDPVAEPSFFKPYCPIQNVSKDYPPTLLLHGDKDTDVPYQQSVMMAKELMRVGVENKLITIKEGGHGVEENKEDDPQVQSGWQAVFAFLNKHLLSAT